MAMPSSSSAPAAVVSAVGKPVGVYHSWQELHAEVAPIWSTLSKKAKIPLKSAEEEVQRGYKAYRNAMSSTMPFIILGTQEIRQDIALIHNMGTLATKPQIKPTQIKCYLAAANSQLPNNLLEEEMLKHLTSGAIVNDSKWWIFQNDLYILGAIHAGKDFHLCYTGMKNKCHKGIPMKEALWDDRYRRPKALGREFLMTAIAGYAPVTLDSGLCFKPPALNNIYTYTQMMDIVESCTMDTINKYLARRTPFQLTPPPSSSSSSSASAAAGSPAPLPIFCSSRASAWSHLPVASPSPSAVSAAASSPTSSSASWPSKVSAWSRPTAASPSPSAASSSAPSASGATARSNSTSPLRASAAVFVPKPFSGVFMPPYLPDDDSDTDYKESPDHKS
jgi:hypothetical protein